jgi:tetratricopeptide (TPR) repeat protein
MAKLYKNLSHIDKEHPEDGIEEYYASFYKREKRKKILIVAVAILVFLGALFFSDLADLIPKFQRKFSPTSAQLVQQTQSKTDPLQRDQMLEAARSDLNANNPTGALTRLLSLLEKEPANAEAQYLAANAYLKAGDVPSAQAHLKRTVTLQPDNFEAQKKLGEISLLMGDYSASREIAAALKKNPEMIPDGLLLESEVDLAENNLSAAVEKAEAAIREAGRAPQRQSKVYVAELYLKKGEKEKAFDMIAGAVQGDLDADAMIRIAKFYLHAGEQSTAGRYLDQALTRHPENPEVRYTYGQYLSGLGKYKEAVPHFRQALEIKGNIPIIAYDLAQALLYGGELQQAKRFIDDILFKEPENLLALQLKTQYEQMFGDRAAAINTLRKVIELAPDSPRPHLLIASLYWQEGLLFMAQQSALKTLELDQHAHTARLILGDVLFKRGQAEPAIRHLEQLLEVQPKNVGALILIGDIYLSLGQTHKAQDAYRRAISVYPEMPSLKTKLAALGETGGKPGAALSEARDILKKRPEDREAVRTCLDLLSKDGKLDEAGALARKFLNQNPGDAQFLFTLGDLLMRKGDSDAAVVQFEKALAQNPQDVNLVLNIGARLELKKLNKVAEKVYRDLLDRMPQNILVSNQLAWLYIEEMNEPQKADDLIGYLKTVNQEPGIQDTIGWYYYKTGELKSAEHHLRGALKLEPQSGFVLAHLARTLLAQKNNPAARTEAEEIIQGLPPGDIRSDLEQRATRQQ